MKKVKRAVCALTALALVLALPACGKTKLKKFDDWFNNSLTPAYASFVQTEDGAAAPSPTISLLLASDKYVNCVFDYIENKTQPENGKITEENGVYTYAYGTFSQVFEFDPSTTSIKITMLQSDAGESRTEFVIVLTERSSRFYIQYLTPDFEEYYELSFTAKGGSVRFVSPCSELPYSIFAQDIPSDFAKEK